MINWKVRFRNPQFLLQLALSIFGPVLVYMGISVEELNTWPKLGSVIIDAVSNPYIVGMILFALYNAVVDPTTDGFSDSNQAMKYLRPKKEAK